MQARRVAVLASLTALVLGGCAGKVAVDAYPTEPGTGLDCAALLADVPPTVAGLGRIEVDDSIAAAWGDPAVILRCGVERPETLEATSPCSEVAGVDWFGEKTASGYAFTTIGRAFFVSVEVPREHEPAADVLVDLAPTVKKHDPVEKPCI